VYSSGLPVFAQTTLIQYIS